MPKKLAVTLTQTMDRKPLAQIDHICGNEAEFTPAQLRALAATLLKIAVDCEGRRMDSKYFMRQRREYEVKP
jgi:hypothetical protein